MDDNNQTETICEQGAASDRLLTHAADGGRIQGAANNAGDFINMIEDGQFAADLHREMAELTAKMSDLCAASGKKQKGRVTIQVDLTTEGPVFMAVGKFTIKAPEEKRKPTVLFTDDANHFTRSQPKHGQFFGVRQVESTARRIHG